MKGYVYSISEFTRVFRFVQCKFKSLYTESWCSFIADVNLLFSELTVATENLFMYSLFPFHYIHTQYRTNSWYIHQLSLKADDC
jgi:zinc transporter ZupT